MSDTTEYLKGYAAWACLSSEAFAELKNMEVDNARLREENARLQEALEKFNFYLLFDTYKDYDTIPVLVWHLRAARAALQKGGKDG